MPRRTQTTDNAALLQAALQGLELQKARVEECISEVRRLLGRRSGQRNGPSGKTPASRPGRRPLSAAARKRIAAAQKRRWEAYRKAASDGAASAKASKRSRARKTT